MNGWNAWNTAALVMLAGAGPACLWRASSGRVASRLVALSLLSTVMGAVLLVLPVGYGRSSYQDVALTLAVLAPAGTLVFTRFVSGQAQDTSPDDSSEDGI